MINVDVLSEDKKWSKKISKKEDFFNKLLKFFPKKYKFINKKVSLTLLLSKNKRVKKVLRLKLRGVCTDWTDVSPAPGV